MKFHNRQIRKQIGGCQGLGEEGAEDGAGGAGGGEVDGEWLLNVQDFHLESWKNSETR